MILLFWGSILAEDEANHSFSTHIVQIQVPIEYSYAGRLIPLLWECTGITHYYPIPTSCITVDI